jgi:hypothetical protein
MKKTKTHRWKYPREYNLPRAKTQAKCECGAVLFFVARPRKQSSGWPYTGNVEDEVIVTPDGVRHVNAKPRPGCTR